MTVTPEGLVEIFSDEFGKYLLGSRPAGFFAKYGYKEMMYLNYSKGKMNCA